MKSQGWPERVQVSKKKSFFHIVYFKVEWIFFCSNFLPCFEICEDECVYLDIWTYVFRHMDISIHRHMG
jgi:hypothetical protein